MTGWGKEAALQGLDLLREAIERDSNYGRALVGAAWCASQLVTGGWAEINVRDVIIENCDAGATLERGPIRHRKSYVLIVI
jgi:hypothetical protein